MEKRSVGGQTRNQYLCFRVSTGAVVEGWGIRYPKIDLDNRPRDYGLAVGVCFQILDGEDAYDLDYGDEESNGENTEEDDLATNQKGTNKVT